MGRQVFAFSRRVTSCTQAMQWATVAVLRWVMLSWNAVEKLWFRVQKNLFGEYT